MSEHGDRWLALDGLRAVAVLFVLLFHFGAPFGTGGYLGVDIFFVISGCVITASLRRSVTQGEGVTAFLWRRAARLYPNLLAVLLVALAIDVVRDGRVLTEHNLALVEQLTATYDFFLTPDIPTPHLWSLSVEWQFYVVLAAATWTLGRAQRRLPGWAAAVALAAASMAAKWLLPWWFDMSLLHVYFWPFTRLDGFMLGVAIALLADRHGLPRMTRAAALVACAVLVTMVVAPRWWSAAALSLFVVIPLVTVAVAVLVWHLVVQPHSVLSRMLRHPALVYLGQRSYSLYLWHYPVGVAMIAAVTAPAPGWEGPFGEGWRGPWVFSVQMLVSLAVAIAAYEWVERPCRAYLNARVPGDAGHRLHPF